MREQEDLKRTSSRISRLLRILRAHRRIATTRRTICHRLTPMDTDESSEESAQECFWTTNTQGLSGVTRNDRPNAAFRTRLRGRRGMPLKASLVAPAICVALPRERAALGPECLEVRRAPFCLYRCPSVCIGGSHVFLRPKPSPHAMFHSNP